MPRKSIKRVVQTARREEKEFRQKIVRDAKAAGAVFTDDSFQNFALALGQGTNNALSGSTYGFNPISRQRTILEWIHRGSWLGGMAIDLVADDMTREGVDLHGLTKPEDIEKIDESATTLGVWNALNDTIKWARLYGGCIAVYMIDGQDMRTPLNPKTIGPGQFRGLMVLDRWMVEPSLEDLVTEMGPSIGLPKYYRVTQSAPGMNRMVIHYSRVIRLEGIRLPYWQRVMENLWGISVLERLYDRMVAFDSATAGAAQLVYKSHVRTYKVEGFKQIVAAGGAALQGIVRYVQMMSKFQGVEGVTVIDGKDDMVISSSSGSFAGIADALMQFGQQISGALQIPLVRMFGQSPAGLNSTGESDLRTYYDGIKKSQKKELKVGVTTMYRLIALSLGITLPDGFSVDFRSLWQLNEKEKGELAERIGNSVTQTFDAGIIGRKGALQELRQSSKITGIYTNITDEDIEGAEAEPPDPMEMMQAEAELKGAGDDAEKDTDKDKAKTSDNAIILPTTEVHGFPIVIEARRGERRFGRVMPAHYGYIRKTASAEGQDEQMDCFVGPAKNAPNVYIVDGYIRGEFDEHKVMFGYRDPINAMAEFHEAYPEREGQHITTMTPDQLRAWLASGDVRSPIWEQTGFILPATTPHAVAA